MLTADDLIGIVRVHADRVHDAVRRLGCSPQAAVQVVGTSALELVDVVALHQDGVDPVGWWFARARQLGHEVATQHPDDDDPLPLGGGVLRNDASQVRLAQALEARPEGERAALLLRDSYDLPAASVGAALGLDADQAMEVVGQARLAFLPGLLGGEPVPVPDHLPLAAVARLGEGGQIAARDATARRHLQTCDACAAVLDAQERARRLLSSVAVVALPDADREALLAHVTARATEVLPLAPPEAVEEDEEPGRRWTAALVLLGLVVAVAVGAGIGAYSSRSKTGGTGTASARLVTAAPALTASPRPVLPVVPPVPSPSPPPRVFTITPSPTPSPTASPTPSQTLGADQLGIALDPATGANDSDLTVSGQGFAPGTAVTVTYVQSNGSPGSQSTAVADARGRFTVTLTAHDGDGTPGPHTVQASGSGQTAQATFTATG